MVDAEGEVEGLRAVLEKTRMQLHLELEHKNDIILENSHLRQEIKKMVEIEDDTRHHGEMSRKINLLEEQVQYLERRLEGCRQESTLTLSTIEGQLGNENGKLKAREKDLRRKLHREKEKSTSMSEHNKTLTTELERTSEEMKMKQLNHTGWMKHVRLPAKGEWHAIKLDTDQNKKALRHIFQQVEKEGGPSCSLDPSIFLHCIVLFLWWKREATFKAMEENEKKRLAHSENEEMRNHNVVLQERIKTLEAALDDSRATRSAFESTMSTNFNQLLKDKYDLCNKVARLEDTVSALHLDNNLLREMLNDRTASKQANSQLDEQTVELKAQLTTFESELKQTQLHKEQLEIELSRSSKRLQVFEQEATIRDTVCKEHVERLDMCDARRLELEKMTSEFTTTIWSLQNNIQNLEESRSTTEKEREAFLSQLSKALGQLEDTKEQILEYQHELRRKTDEQSQFTKTLQEQDHIIGNLRRDLTNQLEATARLTEEKEKRRSLEVISNNHEKLVRDLQERIRVEEVDSATMLADFCEGHAHERMRLERRIDTLEAEIEDIENVVEALSNDKATLRAENQRLKSDFQRGTSKLHDTLRRQALRVFPRATQPRRESTDASTSTDPTMRRSSPVGGELEDDFNYWKIKELEEFIDLLVSIKGTGFARYLLGVDGDSAISQEANGSLDGRLDLEELSRRDWEEEVGQEDVDGPSEPQRSVKRNTKDDVFAKFRALALMMKARQRLRGVKPVNGQSPESDKQTGQRPGITRGQKRVETGKVGFTRASKDKDVTIRAFGAMLREAEETENGVDSHHVESNRDSYDIVEEPLVMKQEQRPLCTPVKQGVTMHEADQEAQQPGRDQSGSKPLDHSKEMDGSQRPASAPWMDSSFQESEIVSDSENGDLMSTLEREQEQLKKVLKTIRDEEALVEEELKREQEAHMMSLKKVTEYQEQCVMMQLEKETLLQEPQDGVSDDGEDDETHSRRSTLNVELEKMLLEELESLKEENEMLMTEKLKQHKLREDRAEGLIQNRSAMKTPLLLSPRESRTASPQRNVLISRSPVRSPLFHVDPSTYDEAKSFPMESDFQEPSQPHNDGFFSPSPSKGGFSNGERGQRTSLKSSNSLKITDSKISSGDSKPQRAGTWPEFESPIHQSLVNTEAASIQTSLDALGLPELQAQGDILNNVLGHITANVLEGGDQVEVRQQTGPRKHLQKQNPVAEEIQRDMPRVTVLTSTVPPGMSASVDQGIDGKKHSKATAGDTDDNEEAETKSTDSERNAFSSRQRKHKEKQFTPTQSDRIVVNTPLPRGLEINEKTPRTSRALDHTPVKSQNDDLDYVGLKSTSNSLGDTYTLQPTTLSLEQELLHARAESNIEYAEGLEGELFKCQTELLGSHRDRQDLLDQLTLALQTEVRLQNKVDKLETKVEYLQSNLHKSDEFGESLKRDKEFLHDNYTAAVEERQSLQSDVQNVVRSNDMLEQELMMCTQHSDLLEKEVDLLLKRSDSKSRSGGRKIPREVEGEESMLESQTVVHRVVTGSPAFTKDGGDQAGQERPQESRKVEWNLNSMQRDKALKDVLKPSALTQDELKLLHHEMTQLRAQLNEAKQAESILQLEIKKLQEEASTLHACLQDNIEFVAQVQKDRDTMRHSLVAVKKEQNIRWRDRQELEADLEAAHQKQQEIMAQIEELEVENKRLKTKQVGLSTIDKLHKDIETLKREKRELQNRLSLSIETIENPLEERKPKTTSEKAQSDEQLDKIFDLESQLYESQTLVREIERERDTLQDDFTEALQARAQLKTQLGKSQNEYHILEEKLEESQTRVKSLREELGEYLQQDFHQRDNEIRILKKKLRELDLDRQTLIEERDDKKLRLENLEIICKMHKEKYQKEQNEKIKLETELENYKVLRQKEGNHHVMFEEEMPETTYGGNKEDEGGSGKGGLDDQVRKSKFTAAYDQGLKSANEDIHTCFERLGNLEQTVDVSVASLQEELNTQMKNISRMRESAEITLQRAVTKTKQLTDENHQEILTMIEKTVALRIKNPQVTAGQRLEEARQLLERSIMEQRKQAASIIMLRQSMEKALLQHSALKIRLRQQTDKSARVFSCWNKERLSLKKQLREANKSLEHIESHVTSAINQSQGSSTVGVIKDQLLQQQVSQTRALKKMVRNCLCQREDPKTEHKREDVTTLQYKMRIDQEKQTMHEYESLEVRKQECWKLRDVLQDAETRERDVTRTLKEVKDQLKIEVEMQSQLAMRSEKQEEEIFKLRKAMGRDAIREQETKETRLDKEKKTNEPRMNEMLSEFSREIKSHLEDHMEKTQLNNETDDRKKIQDLDSNLSRMDAQHCIDNITIQALTDDNRRLRTMVYKLRERIMNHQVSSHKDSRMDGVYQALARAQVKVIATSMVGGSQTVGLLTGASMFTNNIPKTSFTAGRLADRRHMGSAGNSLGDSFD